MWLTCSSVGRKLVMAITGACLVLFVTFHCLMNGVALFWPSGYNAVCEFLGANWYALVATVGLAALFIIHIIYALWLTVQNRKARGNDRYAVTATPKGVEWSSQNMLVLGIVVLAFLVVHLIQFWAKMQLQELLGTEYIHDGVEVAPAAGTLFIHLAFSQVWTPIVYIIGFVALWFHMNHGFWSMFQTAGWDNDTWLPRLKCIACWWTTIVVGLFIAQAIVFTVRAHTNDFETEYNEYLQYKASEYALSTDDFNAGFPFTNPACEGMKADCKGHGHAGCPKEAAACEGAACENAACESAACEGTKTCSPAACGKEVCKGAECSPEACGKPSCKGAQCDTEVCGNPGCAK
ncbi:MAG: succinate dehydrogenase cytochrome b subunit [Duncaniella sp.]|nr:succinate dehydrogenase cytochrome b subunit [Duncaniella sp.]